jgi:hypothetical protein
MGSVLLAAGAAGQFAFWSQVSLVVRANMRQLLPLGACTSKLLSDFGFVII